jgi:purine-binding chemotaxis protein CheW
MAEENRKTGSAGERGPRGAVDWSALFDAMSDRAAEDRAVDVLAERARRLAIPEEEVAADVGAVYALFALGAERYALSSSVVAEVVETPKLTRVPHAPPVVAGLFHRRGGVYVGLATRSLLGLEDGGAYRDALVLAGPVPRLALLVDEVTATRVIPAAEIRAGEMGARAVAGVTADGHIVLEAGALWDEARRALGFAREGI